MNAQQSSRVFVTQEVRTGRIDYSPARQYGKVVFCTILDFSPEDGSIMNKVIIDELRGKLKDFDPAADFIVTSGSPLVIAAVFMILRERTHMVRVLRWSNRDLVYQEVAINLL